jgi:2-C-methyl-D-erythritol 4-phosphate cytidylyltransferase
MNDTVKTSSDGVHAETTLDRSVLWCAQTPQVFQITRFKALLEQARAENFRPTDDAALFERFSGPIPISLGSPHNIKITTPDDLVLAAAILRSRRTARPS